MKLFRKITAMVLIAAMVMALAGCSGNSQTTTGQRGEAVATGAGVANDTGKKSEPVEIVVYSQLANYSGEQQGWSAKLLLDKFNVKLTIIPDSDGVFDTRMESGKLGDIVVFGSTGNDYKRAVKNGMLLDWNKYDLLSTHGQYIKDNMGYALESNRKLTSTITEGASDTLYGFGHSVALSSDSHEQFFYTWDIRWDLYKKLGYPVVKDLNDLITLFERMKEICPTDENGNPTYAVSIWPDWDGNMVMYVKAFATAYWGYDEMQLGIYDPDTGIMHDALEKDGPYLTSLKFFNTLYQKGLLDPNSMTQTYTEMIEKMKVGGVFFSIFNYAGSGPFNTDAHLSDGKYMYTMVPEDAVPLCYGMSPYGGNRVWTIGANTEHPELCMDIINWLSTPDGYMEALYGPKDLTWYYDDKGYACLTEFGKKALSDKEGTAMTEAEAGIYAGGTFHDGELQINNATWSVNEINPNTTGDTYDKTYWRSIVDRIDYDIQQDWVDYNGVENVAKYMENLDYKVAPASEYNEGEMDDDFELIWKQVTTCIVDYSWKAIYAGSDGEFNYYVQQMINTANAYGYEQCRQWSVDEAAKRHALELEALGK
ncbi:MAG: extracellular solute-binding protein [Lachnospiraceae bacterium]|nr:extracellular solute-binding protein [Lachnospiraceae bacterium]